MFETICAAPAGSSEGSLMRLPVARSNEDVFCCSLVLARAASRSGNGYGFTRIELTAVPHIDYGLKHLVHGTNNVGGGIIRLLISRHVCRLFVERHPRNAAALVL